MTEINWARVAEIAREIKPLHDAQEVAFNRVLNENQTSLRYEEWKASVAAYNQKLLSYASEIADLTNNGTSSIAMMMHPDIMNEDIKVAAQDMLNFANYESFNWRLWAPHSGYYREPKNNFAF